MSDETQSNAELTDEQMDDLVSKSETSRNSPERAMHGEDKPTKEAPTKEAPSKDELFEFSHNGKQVKATREQLVRWAQQGINYPQRASELNAQQTKWQQERTNWEKNWGEYKKVDEWAKQNPQQWAKLQETYRQISTGQPASQPGTQPQYDPYASKFKELESKFTQIEPLVQQFASRFEQEKVKAEDTALDSEIQSIRDKYKDLDWTTLNDRGMSDLEFKVLEHAQKTGIPSFAVAFKDLFHDELMQKASTQAKLSVSEGIQNRTRLGLLGNSTPNKGRAFEASKKPIREQSYEDIMNEIRSELKTS